MSPAALAGALAGVEEQVSPLELLAQWVELAQEHQRLSAMNPHDEAPGQRRIHPSKRRTVDEAHRP